MRVCKLPECDIEIEPNHNGGGRPKEYCCEKHRALASNRRHNPSHYQSRFCEICGSSIRVSNTTGVCSKTPKCKKIQSQRYCAANKERIRDQNTSRIRRRAMWEAQNGFCALCLKPLEWEDTHLDHDHMCCDMFVRNACGNCDRGAVHSMCNKMLGMANDSQELLELAIEYLNRNEAA